MHYGDGCQHEPGDPEAFEGTLCWHCGALLYFDNGQWREAREAPGESGQMYIIRLNVAQQSALLSVLIDHSLRKDSTREWLDVVNESAVTIEDLLTLVAVASLHRGNSETVSAAGVWDAPTAGEARPADNLPAIPGRPGARDKSVADKKGEKVH